MAFIFRDMLSPAKALQQNSSSIYQKFKKAWPKETINGVPVFSRRLYFYRAHTFLEDELIKRFIKSIGIEYEVFKNQAVDKEIEDMWFYLRPEYDWDGSIGIGNTLKTGDNYNPIDSPYNSTVGVTKPTEWDIVNAVNAVFEKDDIIEITIQYGGELRRYITEHDLGWTIDELGVVNSNDLNREVIEQTILDNPWYYIVNSRHIPYVKNSYPFNLYGGDLDELNIPKQEVINTTERNTPVCDVAISAAKGYDENIGLGFFALIASPGEWQQVGEIYDRVNGSTDSSISNKGECDPDIEDCSPIPGEEGKFDGQVTTYSFKLKFKYVGVSTSSSSITQIMDWFGHYRNTLDKTNIGGRAFTPDTYEEYKVTSRIDTKPKKALSKLLTREVTNDLYENGQLIQKTAQDMKRSDFTNLLGNTIDTDYKVEEASTWEKIAAFAVVVIAVVVGVLLAIPSAGTSVYASMSAGLAAAGAILGVGAMALSYFGGLSSQVLVKKIGAFAQIVGIAAMVTGLIAAYQVALANVAKKALAEQGIMKATQAQVTAQIGSMSASEIAIGIVKEAISSALSSITDMFTALTDKGVQLTVETVLKAVDETVGLARKGYELYADKEFEELQSDIQSLQKELDTLENSDSVRRVADPLFVLNNANEDLATYDAISYMEIDWKLKHSPQGFFDSFEAERSIK